MIPWDNEEGFTRPSAIPGRRWRAPETQIVKQEGIMPISDYEMVKAWQQVLTLSRLQAGQTVTVLTSAATHPQTLATALIATQAMGAVVNRLDLPPVNGERALSRDALAYLGTTPLTGNKAAIAALKESDLVLDLMTLLFSPEQHEILASEPRSCWRWSRRRCCAAGADRGRPRPGQGGRRAHRRRARDERRLGGGHGPALPAGRIPGHQRIRFRR